MPSRLLRRTLTAVLATVTFAVLGGAQALAGGERTLETPPRDAAPAGLDARLDDVADEARAAGVAAAVNRADGSGLEVAGDRVEVVVEAHPGRTGAVRDALDAAGAAVERSYGGLVKAFVPVGQLAELARADGVRTVEPPLRAYRTAVTGQGVAASNAAVAHTADDKGAGVKVGIVDLGFRDYQSLQAQGELPASVATQSYCTDFQGDEHGTGVAEIVHEVAPGAQLHLICIEDAVDLGAAKDYAVANGIAILNLSVAFFNSGRGDGSGGPTTPEGIVRAGRDAGILWVVAAGNQGEGHWSGTFSGNADGFHEFAAGDDGINFRVAGGQEACVFLKWDAWPVTSTQDFDLGIYDAATDSLVTASAETQAGSSPTEAACVTAPAEGKEYLAAIHRYAGSTPRLDLFVVGASFAQHNVAAGSVTEPASAPEALAVAAICWNGGELEPYSSVGPTIDGRTKPDVAGFDSNSSGTYGSFDFGQGCGRSGFTGTSAAAPHVAGIAAILQEREGPLTAAALRARIESSAEDLGAAGRDNLTGWGRLRLAVPPTATTVTAQSVGRRIATFRGFVQANRWVGSYRWEFSTDPTFAASATTVSTTFPAGATNALGSLLVEGLQPSTTYHARFVTQNEHGSSTGSRVTFTTADTAAPFVSASDPTGVTSSGATLRGTVNPNGLATTYRFSYGTSFPPAIETEERALTGEASEPVSVALSGLTANRTYAYRLTATNSAGTTQVSGTFETAAAPAPAPPSGGGGGRGPDLSVVVGHGPSVVAAGDTFTYVYVVRNATSAKAMNVSLAIGLSPSVELVSTYAEKGPGCAPGGAGLVCPLFFLDGSESTRVLASVRVRANGQLTTTGAVTSAERDANAADNQITYTFTAGAAPPVVEPVPEKGPLGLSATGTWRGESLRGTAGPDTLRGFGGADRLFGGRGNDSLFGGSGDDHLDGGAGRDALDAGPGRDTIVARDQTADTVRCGRGRDVVFADRKDTVARDCETVRRG